MWVLLKSEPPERAWLGFCRKCYSNVPGELHLSLQHHPSNHALPSQKPPAKQSGRGRSIHWSEARNLAQSFPRAPSAVARASSFCDDAGRNRCGRWANDSQQGLSPEGLDRPVLAACLHLFCSSFFWVKDRAGQSSLCPCDVSFDLW